MKIYAVPYSQIFHDGMIMRDGWILYGSKKQCVTATLQMYEDEAEDFGPDNENEYWGPDIPLRYYLLETKDLSNKNSIDTKMLKYGLRMDDDWNPGCKLPEPVLVKVD